MALVELSSVLGLFHKQISNLKTKNYIYWCFIAFPLLFLIWNNHFFFPIKGALWVDPWFYTTGFLDLPWHIQSYGSEYFYSRLSWLIPGAICHKLLSPKNANLLLHIAFYCCGYFSFLGILKELAGKSATVIGVLIYALNPVILWANGWDYVDGCIITYFLCSAYLLIRGFKTNKMIYFLLSGIFQGLLVCANLFALILCAALYIYVFFNIQNKKICIKQIFFMLTGSLLILIALSIINIRLGGTAFFLKSSFLFAFKNSSMSNISNPSDPFWFLCAPWLIVPVSAFLFAIHGVVLKRNSFSLMINNLHQGIYLSYLVLFLIFLIFQCSGRPVLSLFYYANYLFPISAVVCSVAMVTFCSINLKTAFISLISISFIVNTTAICNYNLVTLAAISLFLALFVIKFDNFKLCGKN